MHLLERLSARLRNRHQGALKVAGDCLNFSERQLGTLSNLLKHLSDSRCWKLSFFLLRITGCCFFFFGLFCFLFGKLDAFPFWFPEGWLAHSWFLKALNCANIVLDKRNGSCEHHGRELTLYVLEKREIAARKLASSLTSLLSALFAGGGDRDPRRSAMLNLGFSPMAGFLK